MKILILDIGNSKTKCFVFDVSAEKAEYIDARFTPTNRVNVRDLAHECACLIRPLVKKHRPDYGMVIGFGDAFVVLKKGGYTEMVLAGDPVPIGTNGWDEYLRTGFPTGYTDLRSVADLRMHYRTEYKDMLPINIAIAQLLGHAGFDRRVWDWTQASLTGDFYNGEECSPLEEMGAFEGMPILAGGLDNGFADTTEQTPYICAGTWMVVTTVSDVFSPTRAGYWRGVRWVMSGNKRWLSQTVRKSPMPLPDDWAQRILDDLKVMGVEDGRFRVFGSYGQELLPDLMRLSNAGFVFQIMPYGEEHRQAAIYVYRGKCESE